MASIGTEDPESENAVLRDGPDLGISSASFPRSLSRKLFSEGKEALDALMPVRTHGSSGTCKVQGEEMQVFGI